MDELLSYSVGSVITLTDLQTQVEFNSAKVDFKVKEIRYYDEPKGVFKLVCYLLQGPNKNPYMLMVRKVGELQDLFVYYLDSIGDLYEAKDKQDASPFYALLSKDLKDLTECIQVTVNFDDGASVDVDWDKQNASITVDYHDTEGLRGLATIADYATNADVRGNNRCWVSWVGDHKNGIIEMWYGALIKKFEAEFFHTK